MGEECGDLFFYSIKTWESVLPGGCFLIRVNFSFFLVFHLLKLEHLLHPSSHYCGKFFLSEER